MWLFTFRIGGNVGSVDVIASDESAAKGKLWAYLRRIYGEENVKRMKILRVSKMGEVVV